MVYKDAILHIMYNLKFSRHKFFRFCAFLNSCENLSLKLSPPLQLGIDKNLIKEPAKFTNTQKFPPLKILRLYGGVLMT